MTGARRVLAAQLAALGVCLVALYVQWPTIGAFVGAIDHGNVPLADFVFHYYPTARDSIREGAPAGGFFYPAGFAVMLAPLARAELGTAKIVWGLLLAASVVWTATWVVQTATKKNAALAAAGSALVVTSVPVLHDLKWGQVSVLIVAAGATAFILHGRREKNDKDNTSAALLAVAAAIKGYPIVFLGWFLLRRDLRFFVRAAVASLVTLVVFPALVMGPTHALFFQRIATRSVLGAADGVLYDFNSQFAPAVLARYYGGWGLAPRAVTHAGEIGALAALAVIAALLLLVSRTRADRIVDRRALWAFVLLSATVPFWLKTSWTHYFVHLPLAQILLTSTLLERRRARDVAVLALLVAPSIFLSNVLGLRATEGWFYYADSGAPLFANLFVLLATALVLVEAHVLESRATAPAVARRAFRSAQSADTVSL